MLNCFVFFATQPLSLAEALSRAEISAPAVRVAVMRESEALARRVGAGVFLPSNPRLYGEFRPAVTPPPGFGFAANLEVALEVSGASATRSAEADAHLQQAKRETERAKAEARYEAWHAYVSAQMALTRKRATTASLTAAEQALAAAKTRAQQGAAGEIDVLNADLERLELQQRAIEADADHTDAVLALSHLLDVEPGTEIALSTDMEALPEVSKGAEVGGEHPELQALAAGIDTLGATEKRLFRESLPKISVFGGVDAAPLSPIFGQIGLSIELALFQRNQMPRAVTRAMRETQSEHLALSARTLRRDAHALTASYGKRRAGLAIIDREAIPAAEKQLSLVEVGYRMGRFDIFRLTTAARTLHALRLLRVDVLAEAWRDRIALARALGERS